jgi:integrase
MGEAIADFIDLLAMGDAVSRGGRPYAQRAASNYARSLRRRIAPHRSGRCRLADQAVGAVDSAMLDRLLIRVEDYYGTAEAITTRAALEALFTHLVEEGVVPDVPALRVRGRRRTAAHQPLSDAELSAVLDATAVDDAAQQRSLIAPLVLLVLDAGATIRAAAGLVFGPAGLDLDAAIPAVYLQCGTRDERDVPLSPTVAIELRRHRRRLGDPPQGAFAFPAADGGAVSPRLVDASLRRVATKAGMRRVSPYALRATPRSTLMASLDTSTLAMTPETMEAPRCGIASVPTGC